MQRVLLVEDDVDHEAIYRIVLEHAGYEVIGCGDGRAALDCARDLSPDLILLDLALPRMDGWEVARALKSDERTRSIPLLALTVHALPADRERAERIGFDGYLVKPIEPRDVLDEVRSFLGPGAAAEGPAGSG